MQDIGTYFTKELNLQEIFLTSESHELITRIIPIGNDNLGIESVNNGKNYIENTTNSKKIKTLYWEDNRYTNVQNLFEDAQKKLDQLSKFKRTYETKVIDLSKTLQYKFLQANIGDLVYLINSDTKTKEKFRITKLKRYINETLKNEITLGNKIDDLVTDEQKLKQVLSENWEKTKVFFDVTDKNIKGIVDKQQLTDNNLERLKSTIEQTEEKIIQNVNNSVDKRVSQLKIGARNLLRNSASIDKIKWQKWSATDIEYSQIENNEEWIGFESIKFLDVDTQITSKVRGYYSLNDFKVDDNRKYTLSLDFLNLSGFDINVVIDKAKTDKKTSVKALQNTRIAITFDKKDFDELIIGIETELNQNPIFCVKNIKIEEGTIATSWTPAVEDLEEIDKQLNDAVEFLSSDNKDLLKKYDGLNLENAKIRKELNTALKQTRDEFLFQFNNYKQLLDETGRVVEQRFNDFSRYIRFKNGNIELGDINSPFKALLTHEKISFLKADAEVAYLSKNKLYITDAYIINSLRIGNFEFVVQENGNLSFRKAVD